jgi:SRSO17 transposase
LQKKAGIGDQPRTNSGVVTRGDFDAFEREVSKMGFGMDHEVLGRAEEFFEQRIGTLLGNKKRRASFAIYARGLLGDGERKSMEPIAARSCPDLDQVDALHQRLIHFLTDSQWSDRAVRRESARYALSAMMERDSIDAWIVDDTGFLKQGTHSVGIQRQYTGSAGKTANCQIGVSLSVATRTEQLPIDFELYLPRSWTENARRRKEARIPEGIGFQTKPELAMQMIDRALEDGVPKGVVLADEAYGNIDEFRKELRRRALDYAVGVNACTKVWIADKRGQLGQAQWSVKEIALALGRDRFPPTMWRDGTKGPMHSNFAVRRVVTCHSDGTAEEEKEVLWLLIDWPKGEAEPTGYFLLTLPSNTPRKKLVRIVKERWRTERIYEDLKGELGLDHFEGRRFGGWHHHLSVALCCYAFVIAEKVRAFFPSPRGRPAAGADPRTPRTSQPGFVHHHQTGHCPHHPAMASSMPVVSSSPEVALSPSTSGFKTGSPEVTQ